jgi:hypothetical protein
MTTKAIKAVAVLRGIGGESYFEALVVGARFYLCDVEKL